MNILKSSICAFILLITIQFSTSCGNKAGNDKAVSDPAKAALSKPVPGTPIKYDSSKRYIFLTWDDSPQPPGTVNCKQIFHSQGVKATFFVVGFNQVGPFKKRIIDSLRNAYPEFLIANHSFTHAFNDKYKNFYAMPDSAVSDFLKNQSEMNIAVKIIRLPGNNSWVGKGQMQGPKSTMPVCKRLDSLGYKVIGWDIEWESVRGSIPKQSVDEMVKKVNDKFENGTNAQNAIVILAHDRMFATKQYADSLTRFISVLKQDPRNVFETIDHYPLVQQK